LPERDRESQARETVRERGIGRGRERERECESVRGGGTEGSFFYRRGVEVSSRDSKAMR
jgi:hypothetical protein